MTRHVSTYKGRQIQGMGFATLILTYSKLKPPLSTSLRTKALRFDSTPPMGMRVRIPAEESIGANHTTYSVKMIASQMDAVLSIPNRARFHQQKTQPVVLFYFHCPNGVVPVVGQQLSTGSFVCNCPVSPFTRGYHNLAGPELSGSIDIVQGDMYLRDEGEGMGRIRSHANIVP